MKKNKDVVIFFIMIIISFLIFSKYLIGHIAADSFYLIKYGYVGYAINYSILDGRLFMGLIGLIANFLKIPLNIYSNILMFLAIITSCVCVIVLKKIVSKYKKPESILSEVLLTIICYYTIFHFFYIENLYFLEGFVMALSIVVYILSAKTFAEDKKYIKTFLLLFIGSELYQGTISIFFIFVVLFSMLKYKDYINVLKNFIVSTFIFGCSILLNIIQISLVEKIFNIHQARLEFSLLGICYNILVILKNIVKIVTNTSNLFPKYLYLFFIFIISLEMLYKIYIDYIKKQKSKTGEKIIIEQIILIVVSVVVSFIPSIISLTAFYSGRIRTAMGALVGILFIHLFVKTDLGLKKSFINKMLFLTILVYGLINCANYVYLINLNHKANELDKIHVVEIENYIKSYEKDSNQKVKFISVIPIYNKSSKAFYKELGNTKAGIAVSALRTNWVVTGIINYYTGLNLTERKCSDDEKNFYLQNVDPRDYLCIDNTIYISSFWN